MFDSLHTSQDSINNKILSALPGEEFARLAPHLEKVELSLGQVLYRPEEPITHVYFPEHAMGSLISTTSEGQCVEAGVIGWEGLIGINVLLGVDSTASECIVQLADSAHRIKTGVIKEEFKRGGVLQDKILLFTNALMTQISQTALCNRLHLVEERLARWLLMCHDRSTDKKLSLTQEFLSIMLGVNRPTVTVAAILLQSAGFIKYSRGKIIVIDREGLEHFTCDCYKTAKTAYDKL